MEKRSSSRDGFFNLRVVFGFMLSSVGVFLALLALSVNSSSTALAAGAKPNNGVTIIQSYHNDLSPAMRDVEPWPEQRSQNHEAAENPHISTGLRKDAPDGGATAVAARSTGAEHSGPDPQFRGHQVPGSELQLRPARYQRRSGCHPIRADGEHRLPGLSDTTTGASSWGPPSIESVQLILAVLSPNWRFPGDPVVFFMIELANRWIISEFAGTSIPTDECIAVSTTSDATGTYNRYAFHIGSNFFDYEKISGLGRTSTTWPRTSSTLHRLSRSSGVCDGLGPQCSAGLPATIITMPILGSSFPPMLPADLDGSTLPPTGAPNSFVLWPDTGTYRVYHFSGRRRHLGIGATFAPFRFCRPLLGPLPPSSPLVRQLMAKSFLTHWRSFDVPPGLSKILAATNYCLHFAPRGGHAGVRWFELRGVTAGPVTTFQESTYSPDTTWRWMGSIAMDNRATWLSAIAPPARRSTRRSSIPAVFRSNLINSDDTG